MVFKNKMADFSLHFLSLSLSSHLSSDFVTFGSPHLPTQKAFFIGLADFQLNFSEASKKVVLKQRFHVFNPIHAYRNKLLSFRSVIYKGKKSEELKERRMGLGGREVCILVWVSACYYDTWVHFSLLQLKGFNLEIHA